MEKKKKGPFSVKSILVWFFIITMTFSIGGFFLSNNSTTQSVYYNGYNIYSQNNLWNTKLNGRVYSFTYSPAELGDISMDPKVKDILLNTQGAYLTFDPNATDLSNIEIARFQTVQDFGNYFGIYIKEGIARPDSNYKLPVITCANATALIPVIYMKPVSLNIIGSGNFSGTSGNLNTTGNRIYADGNCIMLEGDSSYFVAMKDRIVYAMIGVMK